MPQKHKFVGEHLSKEDLFFLKKNIEQFQYRKNSKKIANSFFWVD